MSELPSEALLLVALLSIVGLGGVTSFAITGRSVALGGALRLSVAFAIGVGQVASTLFVMSIAGMQWTPVALVVGWPLVIAVPLALRSGKNRDADHGSRRVELETSRGNPWIDLVLLCAIGVSVLVVAYLALDKPVASYDAVSRWMMKARAFHHDGSIVPYFEDLERGATQPHYPPLTSLGATFVYLVLGHEDDRLVKGLFVAFFVALLLGLFGFVRRRASSTVALAATSLIAILPCFVYLDWPPGVGAHAAMADVPLALFTLLSTSLLLDWVRLGHPGFLAISFVCAGFAPFTKQEGLLVLVFHAVVVIVIAVARRSRRQVAVIAASIGCGVAVFLPWYLFQRGVPVTDEVYLPIRFSIGGLLAHADRVPVILRTFGEETMRFDLWNLLWPTAGLALLVAPRRAITNGAWFLAFLVLAHLSAYAVVYALEDFKGAGLYEQKMAVSLTRLFMHVAPIAACAIGLQLEALWSRRDARIESE